MLKELHLIVFSGVCVTTAVMQKMPKLSTATCTFVESRTVQCEMFYIKTLNQKNKTLKEYQQIKINLKSHQKE